MTGDNSRGSRKRQEMSVLTVKGWRHEGYSELSGDITLRTTITTRRQTKQNTSLQRNSLYILPLSLPHTYTLLSPLHLKYLTTSHPFIPPLLIAPSLLLSAITQSILMPHPLPLLHS